MNTVNQVQKTFTELKRVCTNNGSNHIGMSLMTLLHIRTKEYFG